METIMQSSLENHTMTEDSSDRSDESSTMSQEYQSRGFEDYEIAKRLKGSVGERCSAKNDSQNLAISKDFRLSVDSNVDSNEQHQKIVSPLEESHNRELSLSLGKTKKYDYSSVQLGDVMNYQMERINDGKTTTDTTQICRTKEPTMKEAFFNLQSARERYLAASFDPSPKEFNYLVERDMKEPGIAKGYNLTVDRINEFNLSHERPRENPGNASPNIERLSGVGVLDVRDHQRNHLHGQSRTVQDIECIVYERLRRPHHHFLNRMDFSGQSLTSSPQAQQTNVTPIQQTHQQDQQQQQQIKSFTIDAILAHRNNQRERYHRNQQQQMRKTAKASREECQEATGKSGLRTRRVPDASVNSRIVNSGKAKRVRTIFTAEQLERLEGEFARQQYMVGPERLYLAHALRLTEAQVKVWFQNRRIKWRKVNHERQCQAVSEHRQRCTLPGALEIHEDESNDTGNVNWCVSSAITTSAPADDSTLINAAKQHQR